MPGEHSGFSPYVGYFQQERQMGGFKVVSGVIVCFKTERHAIFANLSNSCWQ
jgi:hypothetical protein